MEIICRLYEYFYESLKILVFKKFEFFLLIFLYFYSKGGKLIL